MSGLVIPWARFIHSLNFGKSRKTIKDLNQVAALQRNFFGRAVAVTETAMPESAAGCCHNYLFKVCKNISSFPRLRKFAIEIESQ